MNSSSAYSCLKFQAISISNKQFYQFYLCQSKAFRKQHGENCSANCTAKIQDQSWRQKLCLSWSSASENNGCWQISVISVCNRDRKFKAHIGKKNLDEKSLAGSATVCSNSPPIQRDRFSLAGRKMQGMVPEGSPRAVFFCFSPFQPYTFLSCKSFYQLSFQVSFSDKGLFHNPGIFRNRRAIDAVSLGWVCA